MSHAVDAEAGAEDRIVEEYVRDVRIVEVPTAGDGSDDEAESEGRYRFEAPLHTDVTFEDADLARLYADVYFDVNGFREEGSGETGVPPEVVQAGKDTLAAYLLTQSHTTKQWVASFYGAKPVEIDKYTSWVRERAAEIRAEARRQHVD